MRNIFALVGLLGVLGLATPMAQAADQAPSGHATLKVDGMACGACAATVERLVKKVSGVTSATVSQPKGTAQIAFDPAQTTAAALVKIINEKTSFKAQLVSSHSKK